MKKTVTLIVPTEVELDIELILEGEAPTVHIAGMKVLDAHKNEEDLLKQLREMDTDLKSPGGIDVSLLASYLQELMDEHGGIVHYARGTSPLTLVCNKEYEEGDMYTRDVFWLFHTLKGHGMCEPCHERIQEVMKKLDEQEAKEKSR